MNISNMKTRFYQSIALWLCIYLSLGTSAFASHIIGGNMTYTCLGNDEYEIKIVVYKDCNIGVGLDNPLHLGIADAQSNTHLWTEQVLYNAAMDDTLSNLYPDTCLAPNLCVQRATYTQIVTLPFRATGYTLTYQRCCRSVDVVNLVAPAQTGLSLTVDLTATAQTACNNSPSFNNPIPLQLGINSPFSIDMGATDIDGDSLVYKFYTPFSGVTPLNPLTTVSLLPLVPISHIAPYSLSMPIPGSVAYDTHTGELSGTVTVLGIYAIGLAIKEYNSNGDLLSTVYQDFIINVDTKPCSPRSLITHLNTTFADKEVLVYPNPTDQLLNVSLDLSEEVMGTLYTARGQVLWSDNFVQNATIDMEQLPKGIYMLQLKTGEEYWIKKVVKE